VLGVTADEYVATVIAGYAVGAGPGSPAQRAAADLVPMVTNWANRSLLQTSLSDSYAKGTAISQGLMWRFLSRCEDILKYSEGLKPKRKK